MVRLADGDEIVFARLSTGADDKFTNTKSKLGSLRAEALIDRFVR